jgi:hypothetical protein
MIRTGQEYLESIRDGRHARPGGIVVAGHARPEWLVEIDVTAVIPDEE